MVFVILLSIFKTFIYFPDYGLLRLKDVHAAYRYVIIMRLCLTAIINKLNE